MDFKPRYMRYPTTIAATVTQNSLIVCFLSPCAECDGIQLLDTSSIAPAVETIPYSWQEMFSFMPFRSNVSCVETSAPERHFHLDVQGRGSSFAIPYRLFPVIIMFISHAITKRYFRQVRMNSPLGLYAGFAPHTNYTISTNHKSHAEA